MALIASADQYWRLRIVKVDDAADLDLDWRDDVLYRSEKPSAPEEGSVWRVEAMRLDDESAHLLGDYPDERSARELLSRAEEDLTELTVKGFAERYGCPV